MSLQLGPYLRTLRRASGASVTDLAAAARLGRRTVSRWEGGQTTPRLAELDSLLGALNASPAARRRALELLEAPRALRLVRSLDLEEGESGSLPRGGDLLRALRQRRRRTQAQVAEELGVAQTTVARWERSDAWPSIAMLHALCALLGAEEEEVAALTVGRFTLAGADGDAAPSLDELVARLDCLRQPPATPRDQALRELRFLTLEAHADAQCAASQRARLLLADVYAEHASHLFTQARPGEIEARCRRALTRLIPPQDTARRLTASVFLAEAAVYPRTPYACREGLRILEPWLGARVDPRLLVWVSCVTAWTLVPLGRTAEALALAERACRLNREGATEQRAYQRPSLAGLLARCGNAPQALRILEAYSPSSPDSAGYIAWAEATAHLAMGDRLAARRCAERAREATDAWSLDFIRDEVEALERQLVQ